jgi:hypothetical protein
MVKLFGIYLSVSSTCTGALPPMRPVPVALKVVVPKLTPVTLTAVCDVVVPPRK